MSGKKACLFLKYLVINHKRVMSASELIDTFWPEGASNDPENALQQMFYKVRKLLKNMFPEIENPLILRSRQCSWNPELFVSLDLEQFEDIFSNAKVDDARKTDLLLEAIDMYESGVQTIGEQDWLEATYVYYHTIFLDMCRMVIEPLQLNCQWIKVIDICDKVCELEPCADEFVLHLMQALIMLGDEQMAVMRYKTFREKLHQEYDITPSAEVERMYSIALNSEFKNIDGQNLMQILGTKDLNGAFFCTFNVFSHLVMMEQRHASRSNQPSAIIVFGIDELKLTTSTEIHRLERVLRAGLRGYDAVTRLNANSFAVLLSGATIDTAEMIASRVRKGFYSEFKQSSANLVFQTIMLPSLS